MHNWDAPVGQYIIYRDVLREKDEDFELYMAVEQGIYKSKFQRKLAQLIIQRNDVKLILFDSGEEVIEQWVN
ncbi:MAG: element excision factor XisH family protein [Cyanobacteria bacterium P01_G01_bin.54]